VLPDLKRELVASGVVRPLLNLCLKLALQPAACRAVQRPAAVAIAGLAIGDSGPCALKHTLVETGCIPPLVEMVGGFSCSCTRSHVRAWVEFFFGATAADSAIPATSSDAL
jgi:hypothetical protein